MVKRVAFYTRVSTAGQTTDNQTRQLQTVGEQRGWQVVAEYTDHAVSGVKGRDQRPGLDAMLKDATRGNFDVVAVWALDRLGRSVAQVAVTIEELTHLGVVIYSHREGIDSSTPMGKAMAQMASVFAEIERGLIVERINAGIARAKAAGKHCGRPREISRTTQGRAQELRAIGLSIRKIATQLNISTASVQRALKAQAS